MGLFSGGKSWSTSDSYSGLRGTDYFKPHAKGIADDYRFGADSIKSRVTDFNPLGLTGNGLTTAQNSAFKTLGEQLFSNVSGSYAGRGLLSPENVSGVIGSSLTQAAPTLMDQVYKNQMGNESIMSDRFTQLLNVLNAGTGLAGTESHSASNTSQGNMLGGALAGAIGKWASPDWMVSLVNGSGSGSGGSTGMKAFF